MNNELIKAYLDGIRDGRTGADEASLNPAYRDGYRDGARRKWHNKDTAARERLANTRYHVKQRSRGISSLCGSHCDCKN